MKCPRCLGFMGTVIHYDNECNQSFLKCVNCGEITDSIILKNRKMSENEKLLNFKSRPRQKVGRHKSP